MINKMQISFFETYGGLQSVSGDLRRLPPSCDDRLRMNSSVDQFFGLAKKLGREDDDGRVNPFRERERKERGRRERVRER